MIDNKKWQKFKNEKPFKEFPYSKRNWGSPNHSLCSFFGKLKPSISYHLIETFSNKGDNLLDCFSGSGTIPYEGALNDRSSFAMDINPISVAITSSKIGLINRIDVLEEIQKIKSYLETEKINIKELEKAKIFGFNKTLSEYYHPDTLKEIVLARKYFKEKRSFTSNQDIIITSLLHILHGNRPYALSRNSHPITPYAPTGEFQYKSLIEKLQDKVFRSLDNYDLFPITEGKVFHHDILQPWPDQIASIDAIITSPPFFDSTKYYLTNWLRSWFLGWEFEDFEAEKVRFIDTLQKKSFDVYDTILNHCKERLKSSGVVVFHLGKSHKKDMAETILPYSKRYFSKCEIYNEDVSEIEKHGIEDKGSVDCHQYLVMRN